MTSIKDTRNKIQDRLVVLLANVMKIKMHV